MGLNTEHLVNLKLAGTFEKTFVLENADFHPWKKDAHPCASFVASLEKGCASKSSRAHPWKKYKPGAYCTTGETMNFKFVALTCASLEKTYKPGAYETMNCLLMKR